MCAAGQVCWCVWCRCVCCRPGVLVCVLQVRVLQARCAAGVCCRCVYCRCGGMFHSSTQKKHWLFRESGDLEQLRTTTNQAYCEKVRGQCSRSASKCLHMHMSDQKLNEACLLSTHKLMSCLALEGCGGEEWCIPHSCRGAPTLPVLHEETPRVLQSLPTTNTQECTGEHRDTAWQLRARFTDVFNSAPWTSSTSTGSVI